MAITRRRPERAAPSRWAMATTPSLAAQTISSPKAMAENQLVAGANDPGRLASARHVQLQLGRIGRHRQRVCAGPGRDRVRTRRYLRTMRPMLSDTEQVEPIRSSVTRRVIPLPWPGSRPPVDRKQRQDRVARVRHRHHLFGDHRFLRQRPAPGRWRCISPGRPAWSLVRHQFDPIWSSSGRSCAKRRRPHMDICRRGHGPAASSQSREHDRCGGSGLVAHPAEAEEIVRREPELATFIYSTVLHHDTLEAAVVHRVAAAA